MIVRDEAAVLGRCFESVRDVVDCYVIVDTGSTDCTPDVVRGELDGIPGELYERPWRDFGGNRSELMRLAHGRADYLLLLDADMTLRRHGVLPELSADAYLLGHEGPLAYSLPRLLRGDRRWRFVGATHEYLTSDSSFETATLAELTVDHHGDGGSRGDKLPRDRQLLEAQLRIQPEDGRTVFYLAQTYRDLGERERAAKLYARREQLGGWDEEVFYAALQHGLLVADRDFAAGLDLLLHAFELRPRRLEPLYEIAVRARARGDFALVEWVTQLAIDSDVPPDLLFVHRFVYEWGLRLERSIACAHLGRVEEARALTEELLERTGLPEDVVAALTSNLEWLEAHHPRNDRSPRSVAGRPPTLIERCGARVVELPRVGPPGLAGETNPSIAGSGGRHDTRVTSATGLRVIVRGVNYVIHESSYALADGDDAVRTTNLLAELDDDLSITNVVELRDGELPEHHRTGVDGFEDCRLFAWRDRWWAVATNRQLSGDGRCRQVLLRLDDPPAGVRTGAPDAPCDAAGREPARHGSSRPATTVVEGAVLELDAVLNRPGPARHEKNWMPFVTGGDLCLVYSCRPFTVLRFEPSSAQLETIVEVATDYRFSEMRGGSQGLAVDEGYLFVGHQVFYAGNLRRYAHRFISVGPTLAPTGISPPFSFVGAPIEFCAGIAWRGNNIVLSFGINDARAALAEISLDAVVELLEPLAGS